MNNKLGGFALGTLLAASIFAPQVLSAADCCKYCGGGGTGSETTRWSETCGTCYVSLCNSHDERSPNCTGDSYPCTDNYIDQCGSWVTCS